MDIARYYLCESTLQIFDTAYWSGTRKRLIETSTQHELLS